MNSPYNNYSDEDLLHEISVKRDQRAFQVLFNRYRHLVFGACMKYLCVEDLAKDGVQNVFLKIWIDSQRFQINRFKPWLYSVSKNYCLMELRKTKKEIPFAEQIEPENVEWIDYLHLKIKQEALLNHVQNCLKNLDEKQALCIQKFYLEGLSYFQTAKATNFDLNQVKSFIQNGRRNLKNCVRRKIELAEE